MLSNIWMKVGSKFPYDELQIKFDFRHGWLTFSWVITLCSKFVFSDFSRLCFHISEWKLVASYQMKSYRSSSAFVTVDLLFHELFPFVQNSFSGLLSAMLWHIWMKVGWIMVNKSEIMVVDLNLLGSVGDLYCFSNTFSMLVSQYFHMLVSYPYCSAFLDRTRVLARSSKDNWPALMACGYAWQRQIKRTGVTGQWY